MLAEEDGEEEGPSFDILGMTSWTNAIREEVEKSACCHATQPGQEAERV